MGQDDEDDAHMLQAKQQITFNVVNKRKVSFFQKFENKIQQKNKSVIFAKKNLVKTSFITN